MFWPPSGCTVTTPPCRSWPRGRRSRGISGPTCATTGRLAGARRRLLFTTPRAIADTSIPAGIFRASPAYCRPTPIAATTRCTTPRARKADYRGTVLGPRAPAVLRAGRYRGQCPARQERGGDLADRARSGQAHRRPVRHRARHQWSERRRASARAAGAERAPCRCAGSLAARATLPPVELIRGRRTDRL